MDLFFICIHKLLILLSLFYENLKFGDIYPYLPLFTPISVRYNSSDEIQISKISTAGHLHNATLSLIATAGIRGVRSLVLIV